MADYIEREAALKEFEKVCNVCMALVNKPMCGDCSVADTVRKVKSIPAADVRSVVTCADCKYNNACLTQAFVEDASRLPFDRNTFFCADGKRADDA